MKLNIVLPTASFVSSTPRHAHTYVCRLAVLGPRPGFSGRGRGSGEVGVRHLGHHAGRLVVEVVAVEQPASGVVGIDGHPNAAIDRDAHGVAHDPCDRIPVQGNDLK
jgi:hypothetical protein